MAGLHSNGTMPKTGHVTDLREQWLVRADGALAHRLQDREISSHLCENRYRNQQIREDFPVALNEQRDIEHELRLRELAKYRQAEIDAEIAREMAEINLRRQRRRHNPDVLAQPSSSSAAMPDIDPEELGLPVSEIQEMRKRLEQEERDARLARELNQQAEGQDALLADMRCAVEAQDSELARLLQEREYKKLQKAKEKARQKALLKKQQRLAQQQNLPPQPQATLCDAYSNPRDMIRENGLRLCKSVDSDLNYVEPFEKEQIQSKASALLSKEMSKQYYAQESTSSTANTNPNPHTRSNSYDFDKPNTSHNSSLNHRHPPPPPVGKKPRFPDPVSIRPASHYPTDNVITSENSPNTSLPHSLSENSNIYNSYASENGSTRHGRDQIDPGKRLSVISDITAEGLAKKASKQAAIQKKRKGCKIQ